ncbi:MAG: FAD-dependent oxidoreductase, partial [Acidobacteriota bacterium]
MHIVVLGGGRVGATMARDLAAEEGFDVTLVDASQGALDPFSGGPVGTLQADLSQRRDLARAVSGADLVVGAVPGPMGFDTVRAVIEEGRSIVDISFFEEDAFELDGLARERGVTVLVDCGVAPGASNLILG